MNKNRLRDAITWQRYLGVHLVRSAQPQMSAELDFANIINYKIRDTQFAFYCIVIVVIIVIVCWYALTTCRTQVSRYVCYAVLFVDVDVLRYGSRLRLYPFPPKHPFLHKHPFLR
jgi:hypothetical protein